MAVGVVVSSKNANAEGKTHTSKSAYLSVHSMAWGIIVGVEYDVIERPLLFIKVLHA